MPRQKSKDTDKFLDDTDQSRVNRIHGGEKVFSISKEDLIEISNPSKCSHDLEKDGTEELGTTYLCRKCGIVQIFNDIIDK